MRFKLTILAICLATTFGCARFQTVEPAFSKTPEEIDDGAIKQVLESAATNMIEKNQCVKMETLREQLSNRQCDLSLPERPDHVREMNPGEIYDMYSDSVAIVAGIYKCDHCTHWHAAPASGFFITEQGAFVTNFHVVDSEERHTLVVMTRDRRVFPVKRVLAASKINDVAILLVDAPEGVTFKPMRLSEKTPVGEPVTVISHPGRRFFTLTQGRVSRYYTTSDKGNKVSYMSVTADFGGGASGGPIINRFGDAAGLVCSTSSLYSKPEKKESIQMVFKQCIPTSSVLKLVK